MKAGEHMHTKLLRLFKTPAHWWRAARSGWNGLVLQCFSGIRRSTARINRSCRGIWASTLTNLIEPAMPLLSWIIPAAVFGILLYSGQGVVLAGELANHDKSPALVVGAVAAAYLITLFGTTLAQIAGSSSAFRRSTSPSQVALNRTVYLACRGAWVVAVSACMGVVLFAATGSQLIGWTMLSLIVASMACVAALVAAMGSDKSVALDLLYLLHSRRILFAILSFIVALCPLALGAMRVQQAPMSLASLGPLLISMVGLSAVGTLLGCVLFTVPVSLNRPWLGIVVVVASQVWFAVRPLAVDVENPLLSERREAISEAQAIRRSCALPIKSYAGSIIESLYRTEKDRPASTQYTNTSYLISAEGGGMRAAYWTALGLALLDEQTKGEVSRNTVLLSGVSGGSLGIAAWVGAQEAREQPSERVELLDRFLGGDLLSPLVGGFLFLDVPRSLLGSIWFSATRDQLFEKALADWWLETAGTDFFNRPLLRPCIKGFDTAPALFFNATEMQTGTFAPLSNTMMDSWPQWQKGFVTFRFQDTTLATMSIAQAVHISARFPFLSPGAVVGLNPGGFPKSREMDFLVNPDAMAPSRATQSQADAKSERSLRVGVLLDGGYYDNTGLVPVRQAQSEIARLRSSSPGDLSFRASRTRFVSLHFSNDTTAGCVKLPDGWEGGYSPSTRHMMSFVQPNKRCSTEADFWEDAAHPELLEWLSTPFRAILSVREGHSSRQRGDFLIGTSDEEPRVHMSISTEIEEGFGSPFPVFPLFLSSPDPYKVVTTTGPEFADGVAASVSRMVGRALMSAEQGEALVADWRKWDSEIRTKVTRVDCPFEVSQLKVPLGWTLSVNNRELLRCFARRAIQRTGLTVPQHPTTAKRLLDKEFEQAVIGNALWRPSP
jgi:hypothetical protein